MLVSQQLFIWACFPIYAFVLFRLLGYNQWLSRNYGVSCWKRKRNYGGGPIQDFHLVPIPYSTNFSLQFIMFFI